MWDNLTPDQWREDLECLGEAVPRDHHDPYHTVSPARFRRAVRSLRGRIPSLASHEVIVEFASLLALIGDGHTALRLPEVAGFGRFPIQLYRFSDGVFVRASTPEHAQLSGGRVVAIGDVPVLEAWDLARRVVSRDNEMGTWEQIPDLLVIPEVLHALGIVPATDRATWTVVSPDGETMAIELAAAPKPDPVDARLQHRLADPLWLRRPDENWMEHLPDIGTLYLAYNTVRDGAPEPLRALFGRVLETVETSTVGRVIIDIRRNHGGNMTLNGPLVDGLIRAGRINRWGHLFVIIGRGTFSAAMNLAVDLERGTRALFVGEPTGARPNHFGENVAIVLPRSGLRATVSGLYWQNSLPYDDRAWIAPDLPARLPSTDYLRQRDPAFDAILTYRPGQTANEDDDPPDRLLRKLGLPSP